MRWDVIVSSLIGAATVLLAVAQYREDSRHRARTAELEARRPFLEKQMELCFQASEAAATLATTTDVDSWEEARATFWMLYWGPLSIVEQPLKAGGAGPVESQMVEIGDALSALPADPELPARKLEQPSYQLAHKCRDLIFDSWDIETGVGSGE